MRSMGTIDLQIGFLNLPLSISSFANYQGISFSNVCPKGHDIKMKRWCSECNREIPYSELQKAYKISKDTKIIFDSELINYMKEKQDKSCKVLKVFKENDTAKFKYLINKTYYLIPKEKFEKGYFILLNALKKKGNVLLIDYMVRSRKHIGLIEPFNQYLILFQLIYAEQIKTPTPLKIIEISEKDIENAGILIDSIYETTQNINLKDIKDTYKEELFEAILKRKKVPKKEKVVQDDDAFSRGLQELAKQIKTSQKS